jgi:mRNA-degrading endonuclease RelE of RelBE toxin-antitoxin system
MNKIEKFLRSISRKDRDAILLVIVQLGRDATKVPGIVALTGMKGWFRVRLGRYRILFFVDPKTRSIEVKRITKRDERTYKNLG